MLRANLHAEVRPDLLELPLGAEPRGQVFTPVLRLALPAAEFLRRRKGSGEGERVREAERERERERERE